MLWVNQYWTLGVLLQDGGRLSLYQFSDHLTKQNPWLTFVIKQHK